MPYLLAYFALINAATFLTYTYDKHAARRKSRRTPEKTLHLLALLGGSPAAFLAQQTLRHKTLKRPFQFIFWAIVVLQVVAVLYYLTRG
tara:strand:+ start:89 stop:355 length:267 start_codon:yes stop_codon:yes gene_type:complete